jgi:uncharacterized cupin superfamily protein
MIVRKGAAAVDRGEEWRAAAFGAYENHRVSDAGGLSQFGVYVETLEPGSGSSNRHWHEREDEFLHVLAGEVTVVENDGPHVLLPGDSACWPAGHPNAHQVLNRSGAPCTYLIVGTRVRYDVCHYPDLRKALHTEGDTWRMISHDGTVLKSGRT